MIDAALRKQRLLARKALERAGKLTFKPITSAKWTNIVREWDGSIRVQIEHDNIKGVTPAMLRWWFENLAGTTTWNGVDFSGPEVSHYHLWHHRDHISVMPLTHPPGGINKGFALGAESRIDEQFNDYKDRVHVVVTTTTFDEREFTFTINRNGTKVGHLIHRFEPEGDGCTFYSESYFGMKVPVIGFLFNWLVLPFLYSRASGENWIRHNIEETGRTEDIAPVLYARAQAEQATQRG